MHVLHLVQLFMAGQERSRGDAYSSVKELWSGMAVTLTHFIVVQLVQHG